MVVAPVQELPVMNIVTEYVQKGAKSDVATARKKITIDNISVGLAPAHPNYNIQRSCVVPCTKSIVTVILIISKTI